MVKKLLSALLALFILSSFPLTVLAGDLPTSTYTINWSTVEVFAYGSGTYKKSLGKVQEAGAVSYTHLDVYKRQNLRLPQWGKPYMAPP